MKFAVVLPAGPHRQVFAEVVEALYASLIELGHDVVTDFDIVASRRNIVLAPHLLELTRIQLLPMDTIVWNFEPRGGPSFGQSIYYFAQPNVEVWDYAQATTDYLRVFGVRAKFMPLLYSSAVRRGWASSERERDIDVVFVGSMSRRRLHIIDSLIDRGVAVANIFGVYGAERDLLLARAKVLLNVHYYDFSPNEDTRLTYAITNSLAVSSEGPPDEPRKLGWAHYVPYDSLVESTVDLVHSGGWRQQAEAGYEAFRSGKTMTQVLKEALP